MKINKIIMMVATLILTNVSFAQKGELLITVQKSGNNIDVVYELLNEENVFGLQFDIALPESQVKAIDTSLCISSVGKSQLSGCSIKGNRLRVAILDEGLSNHKLTDIKTGEAGRITLKNVNGTLINEIMVTNVKIYDNKANSKIIKAVVDYKNVTILNNEDLSRRSSELLEK